jgi:cis-3-alkyl-4-acyloxetan-2-one decarboxylase
MTTTVDISPFAHLYPFKSHFADINGLRYHYIDEGAGDPVLMLHGNPTWSFYYRALIKKLSPRYRVICPDHIGCGLSDKPSAKEYGYRLENRADDVAELMSQLGIKENLTLIVHDWGGFIGCLYALRHLETIRRVVITNTAAFLKPAGKPLPLRLWLLRYLTPLAVPAVLGGNLFCRAALVMAPRKRLAPDVKKGLIAPYNTWANRIATLKFVQDIAVSPSDPSYSAGRFLEENLHRLKGRPMLICWGKHDFVFDDTYYNEWRRRFPEAECHLFENAGHYVLEDEPEKVPAVIDAFLKKTDR